MKSIFEETPVNRYLDVLEEDSIVLMAGAPNIAPNGLDATECARLKDCGINALSATITTSEVKSTLANCHANGLKLYLGNASLFNNLTSCRNVVNSYKNLDGLGGWMLKQQISYNEIIKESVNDEDLPNYSLSNSLINETDGKHPVFVGLDGDWSSKSGYLNGKSFPEYLAEFQKRFSPSFFPYIYLPIRDGEAMNSERYSVYYRNLSYFAEVSRYTSVPFWVYCRCVALHNYNGFSAGITTERQLRSIVFSSLAYGAQGIYYWNYRQQSLNGTYTDAPVSFDGNIVTDVWQYLKNVNLEVRAFNSVFAGCEHIETRHLSSTITGLKGFDHPMGPLLSIVSQNGSSLEIQVSHINKGGVDYLVVMPNINVAETSRQKVTLNFSEYWEVSIIEKSGSSYVTKKLTSQALEKELGRGDYLIFTWK